MTNLNAAQLVERINKVRKLKGMEPVEYPGVAKAKLVETLNELRADLPDPTEADVMQALTLGKYRSAAQVADAYVAPVEAVQSILDPTDASDAVLYTLIGFGMNRASIGVQDFAADVQNAIGRVQTLAQTRHVVDLLRDKSVASLNFDLLYGLPHQTADSFGETLAHVAQIRPDRLAIYGYAHVPWMSKRQVMIKTENLPDNETRFALAEQARETFAGQGYTCIGIDHFALPDDSLSHAATSGTLRRNFQGYTDDQSSTLIGLGASAISRFTGGYVQNAPATSAYQERVGTGGLAANKGYAMSAHETLIARIIEDLMCRFVYDEHGLGAAFPDQVELIHQTSVSLMQQFGDVFYIGQSGLEMREDTKPLVRIIARFVDGFASEASAHSAAI